MERPSHLTHIGGNIKAMREHRGITQEELAIKAGLRRATIVDIEAGKTNFEINTLVRICSALKCYLDITMTPAE